MSPRLLQIFLEPLKGSRSMRQPAWSSDREMSPPIMETSQSISPQVQSPLSVESPATFSRQPLQIRPRSIRISRRLSQQFLEPLKGSPSTRSMDSSSALSLSKPIMAASRSISLQETSRTLLRSMQALLEMSRFLHQRVRSTQVASSQPMCFLQRHSIMRRSIQMLPA